MDNNQKPKKPIAAAAVLMVALLASTSMVAAQSGLPAAAEGEARLCDSIQASVVRVEELVVPRGEQLVLEGDTVVEAARVVVHGALLGASSVDAGAAGSTICIEAQELHVTGTICAGDGYSQPSAAGFLAPGAYVGHAGTPGGSLFIDVPSAGLRLEGAVLCSGAGGDGQSVTATDASFHAGTCTSPEDTLVVTGGAGADAGGIHAATGLLAQGAVLRLGDGGAGGDVMLLYGNFGGAIALGGAGGASGDPGDTDASLYSSASGGAGGDAVAVPCPDTALVDLSPLRESGERRLLLPEWSDAKITHLLRSDDDPGDKPGSKELGELEQALNGTDGKDWFDAVNQTLENERPGDGIDVVEILMNVVNGQAGDEVNTAGRKVAEAEAIVFEALPCMDHQGRFGLGKCPVFHEDGEWGILDDQDGETFVQALIDYLLQADPLDDPPNPLEDTDPISPFEDLLTPDDPPRDDPPEDPPEECEGSRTDIYFQDCESLEERLGVDDVDPCTLVEAYQDEDDDKTMLPCSVGVPEPDACDTLPEPTLNLEDPASPACGWWIIDPTDCISPGADPVACLVDYFEQECYADVYDDGHGTQISPCGGIDELLKGDGPLYGEKGKSYEAHGDSGESGNTGEAGSDSGWSAVTSPDGGATVTAGSAGLNARVDFCVTQEATAGKSPEIGPRDGARASAGGGVGGNGTLKGGPGGDAFAQGGTGGDAGNGGSGGKGLVYLCVLAFHLDAADGAHGGDGGDGGDANAVGGRGGNGTLFGGDGGDATGRGSNGGDGGNGGSGGDWSFHGSCSGHMGACVTAEKPREGEAGCGGRSGAAGLTRLDAGQPGPGRADGAPGKPANGIDFPVGEPGNPGAPGAQGRPNANCGSALLSPALGFL